jgi:hypothetical protein
MVYSILNRCPDGAFGPGKTLITFDCELVSSSVGYLAATSNVNNVDATADVLTKISVNDKKYSETIRKIIWRVSLLYDF